MATLQHCAAVLRSGDGPFESASAGMIRDAFRCVVDVSSYPRWGGQLRYLEVKVFADKPRGFLSRVFLDPLWAWLEMRMPNVDRPVPGSLELSCGQKPWIQISGQMLNSERGD